MWLLLILHSVQGKLAGNQFANPVDKNVLTTPPFICNFIFPIPILRICSWLKVARAFLIRRKVDSWPPNATSASLLGRKCMPKPCCNFFVNAYIHCGDFVSGQLNSKRNGTFHRHTAIQEKQIPSVNVYCLNRSCVLVTVGRKEHNAHRTAR